MKNLKECKDFKTFKVVDRKYQLKSKKLGEGTFAQTFLAFNQITGQVLACKMISKKKLIEKLNKSQKSCSRKQYLINTINNEMKTWKSLIHPNIVEFKDYSETDNNIYFFLELCPEGNLESALRKKGHFKQSEAVFLMYQIAKACQHLSSKGILHRDIKTDNILLCENNVVKISDFGYAKMVSIETIKTPQFGTGVGTPMYMSPQILLGQPYTEKCDVWSTGVVFYKILFNLFVWEKTENLSILIERMRNEIYFPPHINVSEWLKKLIKGMLEVDEENRLSIKEVISIIIKNSELARQ